MRRTLPPTRSWTNLYAGYAPRPAHRPVTKFERRALTAGRPVFDLIHRRRP